MQPHMSSPPPTPSPKAGASQARAPKAPRHVPLGLTMHVTAQGRPVPGGAHVRPHDSRQPRGPGGAPRPRAVRTPQHVTFADKQHLASRCDVTHIKPLSRPPRTRTPTHTRTHTTGAIVPHRASMMAARAWKAASTPGTVRALASANGTIRSLANAWNVEEQAAVAASGHGQGRGGGRGHMDMQNGTPVTRSAHTHR